MIQMTADDANKKKICVDAHMKAQINTIISKTNRAIKEAYSPRKGEDLVIKDQRLLIIMMPLA